MYLNKSRRNISPHIQVIKRWYLCFLQSLKNSAHLPCWVCGKCHLICCSAPFPPSPGMGVVWGSCKFLRILCSNKGFGKGPLLSSPSIVSLTMVPSYLLAICCFWARLKMLLPMAPAPQMLHPKAVPLRVFPHYGLCWVAESSEVASTPNWKNFLLV